MFWKGYPVNSWQSTMGCFETIILPHEQTWTHWKLIKFVISSFQCHRGKHPIGICLLYLWKKKTAIYQKSKCTFLWMPIFSSELVSPLFPTISTPFILFLHPVIATQNKEIFNYFFILRILFWFSWDCQTPTHFMHNWAWKISKFKLFRNIVPGMP